MYVVQGRRYDLSTVLEKFKSVFELLNSFV
jgi:hypothetical protein